MDEFMNEYWFSVDGVKFGESLLGGEVNFRTDGGDEFCGEVFIEEKEDGKEFHKRGLIFKEELRIGEVFLCRL